MTALLYDEFSVSEYPRLVFEDYELSDFFGSDLDEEYILDREDLTKLIGTGISFGDRFYVEDEEGDSLLVTLDKDEDGDPVFTPVVEEEPTCDGETVTVDYIYELYQQLSNEERKEFAYRCLNTKLVELVDAINERPSCPIPPNAPLSLFANPFPSFGGVYSIGLTD